MAIKQTKNTQKTNIKTLLTDTELALDAFAASAESASELLRRLGLSRTEALNAADSDEEVESCKEDLRAAMGSSSWRIWGEGSDETQINRLYKIVRTHFSVFVDLVLTAKLAGYAVAEYVFAPEADGFLTLKKVINQSGNIDRYRPRRDGSLSFQSPVGEEILDTELKYLFITNRASASDPAGDPAVARLFPSIMLRRHGLKFAMQFIRRYAQPYIVGKTDSDKDEFNQALYGFNSGGAATIGSEDAIDILKLDVDGSAFKRMESLANARIQKLMIGKVKTTDLETGSRAAQETEEHARNDRIDAYLALLSRAIQHAIDSVITANQYWGLHSKHTRALV